MRASNVNIVLYLGNSYSRIEDQGSIMENKACGMRFPDLKTKNRSYCSVYGCSERAATSPSVRFHQFPKSGEHCVDIINKIGIRERVDRLYAWKKALKISNKISANMRVCSLHFTREDYIFPDIPSLKKSLKKCSVPTCNLPVSSSNMNQKDETKRKERLERRLKRIFTKESVVLKEETVSTIDEKETEVEALNSCETERPTGVVNAVELQASNDIARVHASSGEKLVTQSNKDVSHDNEGVDKSNMIPIDFSQSQPVTSTNDTIPARTESRFSEMSGLDPCEQQESEIDNENGHKPLTDKFPVKEEIFECEYMILDDSSETRLMAVTNDATHARIITIYSELVELEQQIRKQQMEVQRDPDILDNLLIKKMQKEQELRDLQRGLQ